MPPKAIRLTSAALPILGAPRHFHLGVNAAIAALFRKARRFKGSLLSPNQLYRHGGVLTIQSLPGLAQKLFLVNSFSRTLDSNSATLRIYPSEIFRNLAQAARRSMISWMAASAW